MGGSVDALSVYPNFIIEVWIHNVILYAMILKYNQKINLIDSDVITIYQEMNSENLIIKTYNYRHVLFEWYTHCSATAYDFAKSTVVQQLDFS